MVCCRILCRIRNAGSGDQDNRQREQLQQDPLPEISNQCSRIRSQDSQHRQRVSFPADTGTKTGRQSGRKDKQPGKRTPAAGAAAAGSSAGDRQPVQPDPEPGTGDQQRDPSADGVQQDPLPDPECW